MIVGLFPELSAAGGVQRAGRLTAAALSAFALRRGLPCTFLSLNDPVGEHNLKLANDELSFIGFGRSKRRFVREAWRAAGRAPLLAVGLHPNLAPIAQAMKLRAPRMRALAFAHGIEVWEPLSLFRRVSLRKCDLVLAPSADTVRRLIEQQGLAPSKTGVVPWSLGPDFKPSPGSAVSSPRPQEFPSGRIILTVGRWDAGEAYKGVDHLIAALPGLLSCVPDLHLLIVGEGSDLPRLKQLPEVSNGAGHIHFLPFLPAEKLEAAYECCDMFALPSRGEGFGLVFLEAMSHGKPVIGGRHGGIPDIIEDGVCGFLVEYGAVPQLAGALQTLLTDEPLRRRMGEAARQRVLLEYTFDRFAANLAAGLDSLLAAV